MSNSSLPEIYHTPLLPHIWGHQITVLVFVLDMVMPEASLA
jgi:hypothetical protein